MHTTLLPLAITLLSLSPFISHATASNLAHVALPLAPRKAVEAAAADPLSPRSSTPDLKTRNHLKQVTRQQLLERDAKARLIKARHDVPPPPQQSPVPPTTVTVATGYLDDVVYRIGGDIPFDMVLFGKRHDTSTLDISTNGFLRFNPDNSDLDSYMLGNVALVPYFKDLALLDEHFALQYTFTDKRVTFAWQTVPYGERTSSSYIHFELEYLVDTPNIVYVRYLHDSNPIYLNGAGATIGVRSVPDNKVYTYSANNRDSANNVLPSTQLAGPGRTLIIDTLTGSFTMLG